MWKGRAEETRRKVDRLERKVAAACKQSGNPWFTRIEDVASFEGLIGRLGDYSLVYLADPRGRPFSGAFGHIADPGDVIGIVGPEGGLTEAEMESLASVGAVKVSLGMNRLRTETSAFLIASGMILCKKDCES